MMNNCNQTTRDQNVKTRNICFWRKIAIQSNSVLTLTLLSHFLVLSLSLPPLLILTPFCPSYTPRVWWVRGLGKACFDSDKDRVRGRKECDVMSMKFIAEINKKLLVLEWVDALNIEAYSTLKIEGPLPCLRHDRTVHIWRDVQGGRKATFYFLMYMYLKITFRPPCVLFWFLILKKFIERKFLEI